MGLPLPIVATILTLNLVHGGCLYLMYNYVLDEGAPAGGSADALVYVLKRAAGPLGLALFCALYINAVSRFWTKDKPWTAHKGDSLAARINRVQGNTVEQVLMNLVIAVGLSSVDLGPCDVRFPIAWAVWFSLMRIPFAIGYFKSELGRLPGIILGGFWHNLGAVTYVTLVGGGWLAASKALGLTCYFGAIVVIFGIVAGSSTAADKAAKEEPGYGATD
eukprot:TRINITY_DN1304_c0_g4_i2.p2 TRINITY_DN1304_c0_g4~~TRINITY_DN1304_c0_g4_i2.p2  ORF type:complete len:219 (+),score=65.28 TRINITY_DN1304_c0_g4_i2:64-720(+)